MISYKLSAPLIEDSVQPQVFARHIAMTGTVGLFSSLFSSQLFSSQQQSTGNLAARTQWLLSPMHESSTAVFTAVREYIHKSGTDTPVCSTAQNSTVADSELVHMPTGASSVSTAGEIDVMGSQVNLICARAG